MEILKKGLVMSETISDKEIALIDEEVRKNQLTKSTYKAVLNMNPPSKIVRHHEHGKFDYLPITAVERLLDGLFESWKVEILREGHVANGFYMVVRLYVKMPGVKDYITVDGAGFAEFQTKKGASSTDFTQLIPGAGVMAIPKAKTEAIKNAAKSLGNIFGRNLARNDDQYEAEEDVVNKSRSKIANTLGGKNEAN